MLHDRTLPYIFNMVSEEMCVLIRLPDLLSSLRLCLQLMLCNKGKQNRASFPVECFLLPPRGKSNSHRLNKETLQGTSITTFVFGALFRQGWCQIRSQRRDDAFTGNNGNDRTFYARSNSQQSWKKYSTPSAFC